MRQRFVRLHERGGPNHVGMQDYGKLTLWGVCHGSFRSIGLLSVAVILSSQTRQHRGAGFKRYGGGEYQMGEVHARSWCFIGTSTDIFMLKRSVSYAVHRGVGISITRA